MAKKSRAVDPKTKWDPRRCEWCGNVFYKAPTYATCGHPVCVKRNRRDRAKRDGWGAHSKKIRETIHWDPPDNMGPDKKMRAKVRANLDRIRIEQLPKEVVPRAIQIVALKTDGVTPAQVYEIWQSTRKESQSA